jgi:GSCFA family
MQFSIKFDIAPSPIRIAHTERIMMIGSCFTENICKKMVDYKYQVCQNPQGIIFNPVSVSTCIKHIAECRQYNEEHLFYLNDGWHSWLHHSRFSDPDKTVALQKMNTAMHEAHAFATQADWLIVTLGSSFAYRHKEMDMHVSNNHRAPHQWFDKELLDVPYIIAQLERAIASIRKINSNIKIIFTISPVRHLRDGVIDNNRSKARLIESVHQICAQQTQCFYFPSYEIVIDELRDYRFYDIDLAHPNYTATDYVWQRFKQTYIAPQDLELLDEIESISTALNHKPFNAESEAHGKFVAATRVRMEKVMEKWGHVRF